MKKRKKVVYKPKPFMAPPKVSYNASGVPSSSKEEKWGRTKAAWNKHIKARPKPFNHHGGAFEHAFS